MAADDLLIVAGEASGDLHGSALLAELAGLRPTVRAFGLGGRRLADAGLDCLAEAEEISAVGLAEVARVVPRARRIFRQLLAEVERRQSRVAVLIDFPEFNLRLAGPLKRRGVRVVYYISPQIWAWREGRVEVVRRWVDRMLVLFPFEGAFYRQHGIEATVVGHPLVDEVPELRGAWDDGPPASGEPYRVALLPGSRRSEVRRLLPPMLAAARRLSDSVPIELRLIRAPTVPVELLESFLGPSGLPVELVTDDRFAAAAGCHLAICASGTATLELALLGTPMVVVYRVGAWSYLLGKLIVRLRTVSLVNLLLGESVVPELLQGAARPRSVADQALRLLRDPPRVERMRRQLQRVRPLLGESGASRRAAAEVRAELEAAG